MSLLSTEQLRNQYGTGYSDVMNTPLRFPGHRPASADDTAVGTTLVDEQGRRVRIAAARPHPVLPDCWGATIVTVEAVDQLHGWARPADPVTTPARSLGDYRVLTEAAGWSTADWFATYVRPQVPDRYQARLQRVWLGETP